MVRRTGAAGAAGWCMALALLPVAAIAEEPEGRGATLAERLRNVLSDGAPQLPVTAGPARELPPPRPLSEFRLGLAGGGFSGRSLSTATGHPEAGRPMALAGGLPLQGRLSVGSGRDALGSWARARIEAPDGTTIESEAFSPAGQAAITQHAYSPTEAGGLFVALVTGPPDRTAAFAALIDPGGLLVLSEGAAQGAAIRRFASEEVTGRHYRFTVAGPEQSHGRWTLLPLASLALTERRHQARTGFGLDIAESVSGARIPGPGFRTDDRLAASGVGLGTGLSLRRSLGQSWGLGLELLAGLGLSRADYTGAGSSGIAGLRQIPLAVEHQSWRGVTRFGQVSAVLDRDLGGGRSFSLFLSGELEAGLPALRDTGPPGILLGQTTDGALNYEGAGEPHRRRRIADKSLHDLRIGLSFAWLF